MKVPNHIKERRKKEDKIKTNDVFSNPFLTAILTTILCVLLFLGFALSS